jgi:hypothetical protein
LKAPLLELVPFPFPAPARRRDVKRDPHRESDQSDQFLVNVNLSRVKIAKRVRGRSAANQESSWTMIVEEKKEERKSKKKKTNKNVMRNAP